ncbi:Hypothetical predicted protein, partial [Mytilus galloprovincialis]
MALTRLDDYILGTNATLICEHDTTTYGYWQKRAHDDKSTSTDLQLTIGKYGRIDSKYLTIYNLISEDTGYYRCSFLDNVWKFGKDHLLKVPVNGNWGRWTGWSGCSKTCGGGETIRVRLCNDPSPIGRGLDCSGDPRDRAVCSSNVCPVNGNWGRWSGWSGCSKTCGGGKKKRTRLCNNPSPIGGGLDCSADPQEFSVCSSNVCPDISQTTILGDLYVAIDEQDITLECLIKTDPSNNVLYWLKNGKDLRPYLSSKYSGGTLSEQSLTIKNVDNNDGNYTCKLENQFGTSKDVVELKVL